MRLRRQMCRRDSVTVMKVGGGLGRVRAALGRLGLGVRFLGAFTMIAGIIILAGAISAGTVQRGREVALLKTLGVTRLGVVAMFSVEYGSPFIANRFSSPQETDGRNRVAPSPRALRSQYSGGRRSECSGTSVVHSS